MKQQKLNPGSLALYLRTRLGLTQAAVAKACGLTVNDVCRFELGHKKLGIGKLVVLAAFFGVTIHTLFHDRFDDPAVYEKEAHRSGALRERIERREKLCRRIGDAGEDWVARREAEKLEGTPYAGAVNQGYADEAKAGCDMATVDPETGKPVFIEVKSTTGAENEDFYLSETQLQMVRYCAENDVNYRLHRVFHVGDGERTEERVYSARELLETYDVLPNHYILKKRGTTV